MKILLAFIIVIAILTSCTATARGASVNQITLMQREVRDKVYLVYLINADHQPVITEGELYITSRALIQDGDQWRLTVNLTFPICQGELSIDGQRITQQRCALLPLAAH